MSHSKVRGDFKVVGLGLFPRIESDGFTKGCVLTQAAFNRITAKEFANEGGYDNVVFRWKPGTDVDAEIQRLRRADILVTAAEPAADVANLRIVRAYPRLLAGFLVVLGVLATTHALVISTRRRGKEMGVLRALGFSRRQVARSVSTQGATVGVVAVVIGVPVGLALGRWAWVTNARRIGIGTVAPASVITIFVMAVAAVALVWVVATVAGRSANRNRLTKALRVE
jgi:predicted lysophospholipase L1 biosynthesis ABC-type transport system permease subunit